MGIFSKIKDAIFGKKAEAAPPPVAKPAIAPAAPAAPAPAAAQPAAPIAITEVDVMAQLEAMEREKGVDLNWRTSIVDLMKLVGLDSSLANRKELADELGYDGEKDGSAEMNIWLHKAVMRELAKHGGKVPAELAD
jgi:3-oxoacyl-ACP reductase-like protein